MLRLALGTLRFRKGGFVGTFVALFFGAALVLACAGLMETGIRTAVPPHRMPQADLQVVAQRTMELPKERVSDDDDTETVLLSEQVRIAPGLVERIRAVPGVAEAVPDILFPAVVEGRAPTTGHGWASTALGDLRIDGAAPQSGQVVVDAPQGVRVGDTVTVVARGVAGEFEVSGVSALPGLFFTDADAANLAGRDGVDAVGVVAARGVDVAVLSERIAEVGPVDVLAGDDRGGAEFPDAVVSGEGLIVISAVTGGLATLVSIFVVASTLGLSIQQRQRELALLRAIGTTPRQLRRMVLFEGLATALFATTLGCLPGALLGRWLFDQFTANGVVAPVIEYHQGWIPLVIAVGCGLITTVLASLVAARRAARTRPTEALMESALEQRWLSWPRLVAALLAFGGGSALAIVTMTVMDGPVAASTAGPAVMLWAIGLALVAPGVTRVVMAVLRWPLRLFSRVPGEIGLLNASVRRVRIAAAATPIMLATGLTIANIYLQTTQADATERAFSQTLRADAVIASTAGGLPPTLVDDVRNTQGVTAASEVVTMNAFILEPFVRNQNEGFPVQGVDAEGAEHTIAATPVAGSLSGLRGNTIALPDTQAAELAVAVGDELSLRLGDGSEVDVRLAATFRAVPGFEMMLMPADLVRAHTTHGLADQILVRGDNLTALAALVARTPGAVLGDRSAMSDQFNEGQKIGVWVNYMLVGMIVAYTVIAVVNTLVMATMRRRREFGLQRLAGSTRGQVLRMMGMEGLVVALVGVVLGTIVSLTTLVPFCLVVLDSPFPVGPVGVYLVTVACATALALAASLLPAWAVTRAKPVEAASSAE